MIELSDREKAILAATAGIALTAGMWIGVWLMPAEALSVPTSTEHGEAVAAYTPVPNGFPLFSLVIVGVSLFIAYSVLTDPEESEAPTPATDGGQEDSDE